MAVKRFSDDSSIKNTYRLSRGAASAAIPNTPTIGVATAVNDVSATVAYTAAILGATASSFTATSTPGSLTGTGSSPITVSGLTASTSYTFTVRATNSNGSSSESSASNSITTLAPSASYESIATITVGSGGTSNIEFTSIPSTYTHLQLRVLHKNGTSNNGFDIQLNSDSTSGRHTIHSFGGTGEGIQAVGNGSSTFGRLYGSSTGFGAAVIDILDYKNTNKARTVRALCGYDQNGSGLVSINSFLYNQTTAITSIKCFPSGGYSWDQYSHFALYGIKGA